MLLSKENNSAYILRQSKKTYPSDTVQASPQSYQSNIKQRNHDHPDNVSIWLVPQVQALLPVLHKAVSEVRFPQCSILQPLRGTREMCVHPDEVLP